MAELEKPPVTFGIAGVIGKNASGMFDQLSAAFSITPKTVVIKWLGDDFSVVTYQHYQDVQLEPGVYEFPIPKFEAYQGVIFGQFFGPNDWFQGEPGLSRPQSMSWRFVENHANGAQKYPNLPNEARVGILWEKQAQRAHLVRDELGILPLYATEFSAQIVFSSDLRVFPFVIPDPLDLDDQAIAEFLHYLYVPAPRTVYKNIWAVLPGHFLIKDDQKSRQERYSLPRFIPGERIKDREKIRQAVEKKLPEFESYLRTAVSDALPSQGRIGLLLSGGKDSSALAIALSQIVPPERILAYTIGFEQAALDESRDAARVCEFLKIPHQAYIPKANELVEGVLELAKLQDQPFADPASLPLYLGLKHLPEDVDVVWDGTGTDYYFGIVKRAGWKYYHLRRQLQKVVPKKLLPFLLKLMSSRSRNSERLDRVWKAPIEEVFVSWDGWSASELKKLFGCEITFDDTYLWQFMHQNASQDWRVLQTDVICHIWEPHAPFRKAFYLGQQLGRSVRFPFTDNRLAGFINSLPQELKFEGDTNKILLRAYLSKYLPRELLQKPKGSFVFDLNMLLRSQNFKWLNLLQDKQLLKTLPFWSDEVIEQLLLDYQNAPISEVLYRLYSLALISTWVAAVEGRLD